MLINLLPTVLILTQKWVCKSRKRQGSAACTGKDERSGAIRSKPFVRVSRVRSRVCFLEDEIQRGVYENPMSHDGLGDISTSDGDYVGVSIDQPSRRAVSETAKGIESRPNHDVTSHSVNAGSPSLVGEMVSLPKWRRSSRSTLRLPVMGLAAGRNIGTHREDKQTVMAVNSRGLRGEGEQFSCSANYRKEDC